MLVALTIAGDGSLTRSALGANCGDNEQLFIRAENASGNPMYRLGTLSRIYPFNRNLDTDCPHSGGANGAYTLSTAHLSSGNGNCAQVEIGHQLLWKGSDVSSQDLSKKIFYVFTEQQTTCTGISDFWHQSAANIETNNDDIWRVSGVEQPGGGAQWHLSVNFVLGQGYVELAVYDTAWNSGIPNGETERFGEGTGLRDSQWNLQFKKTDGTWINWPHLGCSSHPNHFTSSPWRWDDTSTSSYEVAQSGGVWC